MGHIRCSYLMMPVHSHPDFGHAPGIALQRNDICIAAQSCIYIYFCFLYIFIAKSIHSHIQLIEFRCWLCSCIQALYHQAWCRSLNAVVWGCCCSEGGLGPLDPDQESLNLNPIEHLCDELEWRLWARPSRPTSVSDLTNVLLEEWSEIPISTNHLLV